MFADLLAEASATLVAISVNETMLGNHVAIVTLIVRLIHLLVVVGIAHLVSLLHLRILNGEVVDQDILIDQTVLIVITIIILSLLHGGSHD